MVKEAFAITSSSHDSPEAFVRTLANGTIKDIAVLWKRLSPACRQAWIAAYPQLQATAAFWTRLVVEDTTADSDLHRIGGSRHDSRHPHQP